MIETHKNLGGENNARLYEGAQSISNSDVASLANKSGSVGGRSGSAKTGGYNPGLHFAAEGSQRASAGCKDLRGSSPPGGYTQGNQL